MRSIIFTYKDEDWAQETLERISQAIEEKGYGREYELRDIILMRWKQKNQEKNKVALMVADCVPMSFNINLKLTDEAGNKRQNILVESELFPEGLSVPNEVSVSMEWVEDTTNRYKIVKLNHDKIVEMIKSGISPEEISKTFGIKMTEEYCKKILEKDILDN